MKLVTPEQMNTVDACTIKDYGIPGILLMENAASAVVMEVMAMTGGLCDKRVLILAGRGNNGGDAFAAARLLYCKGIKPSIYLLGSKEGISGDALTNLAILEKISIPVNEINEEKDIAGLSADIIEAGIIVDGIFGTGLSRDINGLAETVIKKVNASGKTVISIDIPSGVDGKTGEIRGCCIKASTTVTFCLLKIGLVLHPGCEYTGRLIVADIGIPGCALESQNIITRLIDKEEISGTLPIRIEDSNKGDYGRVLLVTGSPGMTGSGCLASMAALRSGAGLVYTGVPRSLLHIYGSKLTEPVIIGLEDNGTGVLAAESAAQIRDRIKCMEVIAVGPGLTASESVKEVVKEIIVNSTVPLVLDADALNALSGNIEIIKSRKADIIITPHPGEMSRLTGLGINEIQEDRPGVARRFSQEFGITVVLKGSRTVIAHPDGRLYVNSTGNAGMATAGSGDVLTGIIAGLIAQGTSLENAAVAGVYLHGLAGDAAAAKLGMHSMLAGDIVEQLPQVFKHILHDI